MTYQEYFRKAIFQDIWNILSTVYEEKPETRPLYIRLVDTIKELPILPEQSNEKISLSYGIDKDVQILGAPDPQEWLVGREVEIEKIKPVSSSLEFDEDGDEIEVSEENIHPVPDMSLSEIAAHLLYWSTLYAIKTHGMQAESFKDWFVESSAGPYYDLEGNMVKYIFLDFDGVLNTEQYQAELSVAGKPTSDEYGPLFDPKAVERLAIIVEKSKAKIVITSSWRHIHDEDTLNELWEKRGLPGKIYRVLRSNKENESRGEEIQRFLDPCKQNFTPYVIIDDINEFLPDQLSHVIITNPVKGISKNDVEKAILILNALDDKPINYFIDIEARKERRHIQQIESESSAGKRLRFWRNKILEDSPWDWSWNLTILKKKLEYNIGYWRYVQRHVGWEEDVKRMQLCCRLLDITSTDYPDMDGVYVNEHNAKRYKMKIEHDEFLDIHLKDLRREKAYHLVWKFMDHNMKRWWD